MSKDFFKEIGSLTTVDFVEETDNATTTVFRWRVDKTTTIDFRWKVDKTTTAGFRWEIDNATTAVFRWEVDNASTISFFLADLRSRWRSKMSVIWRIKFSYCCIRFFAWSSFDMFFQTLCFDSYFFYFTRYSMLRLTIIRLLIMRFSSKNLTNSMFFST